MIDGKDALLCNLLDCGIADLSLLEDIDCDWSEVVAAAKEYGEPLQEIGFNGLMRTVVCVGLSHIQDAITTRINDLEIEEKAWGLSEDEAEELEQLCDLRPFQDIGSWHNYLDSGAYFEKHKDIYNEYLSDALEQFENETGFNL